MKMSNNMFDTRVENKMKVIKTKKQLKNTFETSYNFIKLRTDTIIKEEDKRKEKAIFILLWERNQIKDT